MVYRLIIVLDDFLHLFIGKWLVEFYRLGLSSLSNSDVGEFDEHGEGDGKVDVPFWDLIVQCFQEKHEADEDEEPKGKHFHGRVLLDEPPDGAAEDHHNDDGYNDSEDHNDDFVAIDNSHRGEDGIEGEDDVQQDDLNDCSAN